MIASNGAIDPRECLTRAANILTQSLAIFADPGRLQFEDRDSARELDFITSPDGDGLDDVMIEELELGVRSYNCLKREGVETVADLVARSEAELLSIPNFGKKSIEEVRERLAERGYKLRGE